MKFFNIAVVFAGLSSAVVLGGNGMRDLIDIYNDGANSCLDVRALSEIPVLNRASSFAHATEACSKEDEADCTEFCKLNQQTSQCVAAGNKITCSCKGGKSETKCEERCLLCMPDKSSLEAASHLFKQGRSGLFKNDF